MTKLRKHPLWARIIAWILLKMLGTDPNAHKEEQWKKPDVSHVPN